MSIKKNEQQAKAKQRADQVRTIYQEQDQVKEAQALLQNDSDEGRHLFTRGRIGMRWSDDDVEGHIGQLLIDHIHVPLPYARALSGLVAGAETASRDSEILPSRYRVRLRIGNRPGTWIDSVELTQRRR